MPTSDPAGTFTPGDVVKVPFPYTDRAARQRRPALVVSGAELQARHGLCWVLMITSAVNRGWDGDLDVEDLALAGLPAASVIRTAKIATIDASDAAPLGRVDAKTLGAVRRHLGTILAPDRSPRAARRSAKR
jgi:mRNA interferase MazF